MTGHPLTKETFLEVLHALTTPNMKFPKDLPDGDALVLLGQLCSDVFTGGVDILRNSANSHISDLMSYAWDVFHNHHALLAIGPKVPSLSITAAIQRDGNSRIIVIPPHDWPDMVQQDNVHQMGAIVFVCSQVVDIYNRRVVSKETKSEMVKLATSYESEFLHFVLDLGHDKFNEYQQGVMKEFPNGLDTSLLYERKKKVETTN